jgi:DNA-binding transcriptional MerR regulator/methylmalonyl-CoA mutase cobalamin-binding subunit
MPATLKTLTPETELYPIRTVASLTGVNPVTLRAWERRHGLIKPIRTPKGHRLYTGEDVDLIHRILALLDRGMAISQIRHALEKPATATKRAAAETTDPWTGYREEMIAGIARFDEERLENIFNEALSLYPTDLVTRRLLLPLLEQLGQRWETSEGTVAEEHFFGVYLRNKLGARFHHRARGNTGPRLMIACLPGEQHEIGMLLFALAAHDRGYRLILLGANTPLAKLPAAVKHAQADALVLSGSIDPEPRVLEDDLPPLVVAAGVPVFVGGRTSVAHRDAIVRAGAQPLGGDIEQGLKRLAELFSTSH